MAGDSVIEAELISSDSTQLPQASESRNRVPALPSEETSLAMSPAVRKIVSSHVVIWTGILAFGPLALPLLWLSPKYSTVAKTSISVLLIGFTVVLPIAGTLYMCTYGLAPIVDAMQQSNIAAR